MKTLVFTTFLIAFTFSYSQSITQLEVLPTNFEDIIEARITVQSGHLFLYKSSTIEIQGGTIFWRLCYSPDLSQEPHTIITETEITLPLVPKDYQLQAEIYFETPYPPDCNNEPDELTDAAILPFSAPLEEPVVLAVESTVLPQFTVAPNPAHDFVRVSGGFNSVKKLTVFNAGGQRVQQVDGGTLPINIDVSKLKTGLYFLRIETKNATEVKKLVVAK